MDKDNSNERKCMSSFILSIFFNIVVDKNIDNEWTLLPTSSVECERNEEKEEAEAATG